MLQINRTALPIAFLALYLSFGIAQAKSIDEDFFVSEGVKIFYQDSKIGAQTIVLLHGYSMDHTMWSESGIYDSLAKNNRVISLDMRGHGKSDKPLLESDYGPQVGLDVINLLDELKIEAAHFVGFSMGAFVAGRLLVTHPNRISSATFCSGGFPIENEQEKEFQDLTANHMEEAGNPALASVAKGWVRDAVTKEQIADIKVPMLAVFGSEELDEITKRQIELLELPTSSQATIVIEGADHDSPRAAILHPKFLAAVEKFISSHL